jgi:predicted outer membrane repeat protein
MDKKAGFPMANRFRSLPLLIFTGMLLTSCNLPQLSQDAALGVQEDVVACSFEALVEALDTKDEITLSPGCVYEITSEHYKLPYPGGMSSCVAGLSADSEIIHGNGATLSWHFVEQNRQRRNYHLFHVKENGELRIENLRIENVDTLQGEVGSSGESCSNGGVIYNEGSVVITNSEFVGNRAAVGGVISSTISSSLQITNTLFENNESIAIGGAINTGSFSAIISDSTFRNNQAGSRGGAIANKGAITILNSSFNGNIAGQRGGAVYHFYFNESGYTGNIMQIENSSLINNWALVSGGGIENDSSLVLLNNTISQNHAGGINNNGQLAILTASYSTITWNAGNPGVRSNNDQVSLENMIITHNYRLNCEVEGLDPGGAPNLDNDESCPGFTISADPLLGPLASNGGPTLTHALPGESPAVDSASGDCPGADQRGVSRPDGDACDLGAFEFGLVGIGGLPPFLPEMAEPAPDKQEFSAEAYLPEGDDGEPSERLPTGRIDQAVLCYEGPGPVYGVVSSLRPGALVEIVGISENGDYIVIFNPCYPGVPCWADEGSIDLHDELAPNRVIPDPAPPEEKPEDDGPKTVCTGAETTQPQCEAAGGSWSIQSFPPCTCQ